jgi:hypothetical protein
MLSNDEIIAFANQVYQDAAADKKAGRVNRARLAFARKVEAITLQRAAGLCAEGAATPDAILALGPSEQP